MGIVRGTPFQNDSFEECAITVALRLAERYFKKFEENRADMAMMPFVWRLFPKINDFFLFLHLNRAVSDLIATMKENSFTKDPILPILVGELLSKVERFDESAACFGKSLEILSEPDQDIRIRALLGKFEAIVAQMQYLWLSRKTDDKKKREAEMLYDHIVLDISAVSSKFRFDFDTRLTRAKVSMDSLMFKRLSFS